MHCTMYVFDTFGLDSFLVWRYSTITVRVIGMLKTNVHMALYTTLYGGVGTLRVCIRQLCIPSKHMHTKQTYTRTFVSHQIQAILFQTSQLTPDGE